MPVSLFSFFVSFQLTEENSHLRRKRKLSLKTIRSHTRVLELQLHSFLTSALDVNKESASIYDLHAAIEPRKPMNMRQGKPKGQCGSFVEDINLSDKKRK